jgi:beta-lactamase regulating signal transducer with metallopeptidase domain
MIETLNKFIIAYLLNALWQVPLLWLAAEIIARLMKPVRSAMVHRVWVGCLGLAVLMPAAPLLCPAVAKATPGADRIGISAQTGARIETQAIVPAAGPKNLLDAPQVSFGETNQQTVAGQQPARSIAWMQLGIRALCVAYVLSVLFALAKLAWGLWRTARLLRGAQPAELAPGLLRVWERCRVRSGLSCVKLLSSPQVTSPSTLTLRGSYILLPKNIDECAETEMSAALCHELAHIKRHDFLKNLAYELLAAPLSFHPALHGITRGVQVTRELACDDMAAAALDGRGAYARSLVRLAEAMSSAAVSVARTLGVFEGNVLEKRVMNLIEARKKQTRWRLVVSTACGLALLAGSCVASARFGLRPVLASSGMKPVGSAASLHSAAPAKAQPATNAAPAQPAVDAPATFDPDKVAAKDGEVAFVPALEASTAEAVQQTAPDWLQNSAITNPPQQLADPGDLKPVAFELGQTYFAPGDNIVIDKILGSSDNVAEGNVYEISGRYTLVSHNSALLAASVTTNREDARPGASPSHNMTVNKGNGEFTVWLWLGEHGEPHLSFYPSGGGSSFAGVYFKTAPSHANASSSTPAPAPGQTREAPKGWSLQGSDPTNYVTGLDKNVMHDGQASAYLQAMRDNGDKFGTLSQWFKGKDYLGKRVRFRAWVRSQDVSRWAGLWMRVDEGEKSVAFDNMQSRAIKGTTDWKLYDIVLDVPKKASDIALGILLAGPGKVWMSGVQVDVVGPEVATTGMMGQSEMPDGPTNLDFGK